MRWGDRAGPGGVPRCAARVPTGWLTSRGPHTLQAVLRVALNHSTVSATADPTLDVAVQYFPYAAYYVDNFHTLLINIGGLCA